MPSGDCVTIGWVGFSAAENGDGMLSCACDDEQARTAWVCEKSGNNRRNRKLQFELHITLHLDKRWQNI